MKSPRQPSDRSRTTIVRPRHTLRRCTRRFAPQVTSQLRKQKQQQKQLRVQQQQAQRQEQAQQQLMLLQHQQQEQRRRRQRQRQKQLAALEQQSAMQVGRSVKATPLRSE